MLHPRVLQTKGRAFLVLVCLAVLPISLFATIDPNQLWNDAVHSLQNQDPKTACSSLEDWVQVQQSHNIKSAEAYFNLALCSWQLKAPSESVFWAVQSLNNRNSPLKRFSDIQLLQSFQREIGIRQHLPGKSSFILRMLFPNWIAQSFGVLGFWSLVIYLLFFRKQAKVGAVCLTFTATTWVVASTILALTSVGGPIAVIASNEPSSLFTFDKSGKPVELAKLPTGTLIEIGPSKESSIQVLKPVGGWVKQESIKVIIPDS